MESKEKDWKSPLFFFYVTTTSILAGFGLTLARARKSSPQSFGTGNNEGARLAAKALGYGTLLSVSGCSLLVIAVAKAMGVSTAKEFGDKMRGTLPSKGGEFVHKFDNWPTKFPKKPDDGKWREEIK